MGWLQKMDMDTHGHNVTALRQITKMIKQITRKKQWSLIAAVKFSYYVNHSTIVRSCI